MNSLADLAALADLLPDGIVVVDARGRIVCANAHVCELLGYEREELLGEHIEVLVPEAARGRHVEHRSHLERIEVTRPMGSGVDLRARRSDGTPLPVDISLRGTELDGVPHIVAAVRDMTDQRALEQRNAFLDVVRDATRSAVLAIDATGSVAGCNLAAQRLLGVDATSCIGKPAGETVLARTPALLELLTTSLAGRAVDHERLVLTTELGEQLPVGVVSRPIRDRHREVIGVSVLLFDLSEQEASQVSLSAAGERLDTTERLAGLGAWELDGDSGELQLSPGLHTLLGLAPHDHDGTITALVRGTEPEVEAELRLLLERCAREGEPFYLEYTMEHPDGSARWLGISGNRTLGELATGRRQGHGIVQDLTASHQVMESLLVADRMKDEFLATVSHELRTPLTVIVGFADFLRASADDTNAPYFEAMHRNAREMDLMVDQLLDLSRVQSGKAENAPRPQSLRSLVEDVLGYAALALVNHEVRNETADTSVLVDPMGFRRILTNLLTNAAKFSARGTTVVIEEEAQPHEVVVSVRDQGVGIAAEELDQIFEQFVQAKNGRPTDVRGTGVGLAIAKRYVELARGRIWVESQLGAGSTFRFTVPRPASDEQPETGAEGHDQTDEQGRV